MAHGARKIPVSNRGWVWGLLSAESGAPRRWGFAADGQKVQGSCPRSRDARSRWPAEWMLPRACRRQLRPIDPRARPGSVAPAAPRGSIESSSLSGHAARRALCKHRAYLHRGTRAPGLGVAAGGVFPGSPRPPPPAPAARPPRAQEFQAQRTESVPPPPLRPGRVVAARPRLARGRPGCVAWGRSACPVWKVILGGSGFPGRPRSARVLAASSTCLLSLCEPGIVCRSGSWAAGRSFGRPSRKHGKTQLETQPEGTERTNTLVRPEPPVTPLHRDHIP